MQTRPGRTVESDVLALQGATRATRHDELATEEPLELRVSAGEQTSTLAITMRTPGNDFELAAGFAYGESIVNAPEQIRELSYCLDESVDPEQRYNIVTIALAAPALPDLHRLERHFAIGSACGICGRAQLTALKDFGVEPIADDARLRADTLYELPERMRAAQRVFSSTGGLHAAGLLVPGTDEPIVREDVGRHNAVDKVVGWALLGLRLPLAGTILIVSGRASYEIVQKAVMARIPIVCAVSAPSSLAVDLAREFNLTLAGFVRDGRANVYSAPERII
jgi:FdhD protein